MRGAAGRASTPAGHVLGVERLRNPDLGTEIRVIATLGPSTVPLVAATAVVPEAVQARIATALCELGREPGSRDVLAGGLIRRFTSIDDSAYGDIRQVAAVPAQRGWAPPPARVPPQPPAGDVERATSRGSSLFSHPPPRRPWVTLWRQ